jgi:predicted secreted protein
MATGAKLAQGTQLQAGDGASPEVFTTIAEILSIGGPSMSFGEVDVTNMDSTGSFREFIGGLGDAGKIEFTANYIVTHATQDSGTGLWARFLAKTVSNYRVVFTQFGGSPRMNLNGYIDSLEVDASDPASQLKLKGSIRLSGAPTFTGD